MAGARFSRTEVEVGDDGEAALRRAIAATKSGDTSALHFLYVRYADDVRNYVRSIVRDPHDAEDITQDIFAKLMRAIGKYERREVPFTAWILRVARNAALDHMRGRRLVPSEEVHPSDEGYEQVGVERLRSLREALQRVPEDQREVLALRHRGRGALRAALAELGAAPVIAAV